MGYALEKTSRLQSRKAWFLYATFASNSPPFRFLCPHLRSPWAVSRVNQNCRHRAAPAGLDLQVTHHGIGGWPAPVKRHAGLAAQRFSVTGW